MRIAVCRRFLFCPPPPPVLAMASTRQSLIVTVKRGLRSMAAEGTLLSHRFPDPHLAVRALPLRQLLIVVVLFHGPTYSIHRRRVPAESDTDASISYRSCDEMERPVSRYHREALLRTARLGSSDCVTTSQTDSLQGLAL